MTILTLTTPKSAKIRAPQGRLARLWDAMPSMTDLVETTTVLSVALIMVLCLNALL
ncbi:hypothetical protein [Oleisolibacter albus]|uniref:hypothetical protein n=1 Tax=Oleisolibacter albus TaxID=2171757 RepID=UPI0012D71DF4|nr:hypothetical protein [Oleisolibacter albus]